MHFTAVRAFADNFVWLMRRDAQGPTLIVDPGQAEPVLAAFESIEQPPAAILLTHHHADHIGGVTALLARWPSLRVIGPLDPRVNPVTERVAPGDVVDVAGFSFAVLDLAAHTSGHIGYYTDGALLCGDALFSLGCGRLFEGTPADLHQVMKTIAKLPRETLIFGAHEYTLANSQFALHVDPRNAALKTYGEHVAQLRRDDQDTLPSTLATELDCNPFLRSEVPEIAQAIDREFGSASLDAAERIGRLREWKDRYVA